MKRRIMKKRAKRATAAEHRRWRKIQGHNERWVALAILAQYAAKGEAIAIMCYP